MIDGDELELLRGSHHDHSQRVRLVVHGCAYSCCGRGWQRRDGYEQEYHGWVDNLHEPAPGEQAQADRAVAVLGEHWPDQMMSGARELLQGAAQGSFMLYSAGIGTISYVIAVRFDEVDLVEAL